MSVKGIKGRQVDALESSLVKNSAKKLREQQSQSGTTQTASDQSGATVQISSLAREIESLADMKDLERSPNFEKIKEAVQSGKYEMPSNEELARKLISELF